MPSRGIAFSLAEDRLYCKTGLRRAIPSSASAVRYIVYVYRATLTPQFALWVQCFPRVTLIPEKPAGAMQWNCKPQALKLLLCGLVGIRVGLSETFSARIADCSKNSLRT